MRLSAEPARELGVRLHTHLAVDTDEPARACTALHRTLLEKA